MAQYDPNKKYSWQPEDKFKWLYLLKAINRWILK